MLCDILRMEPKAVLGVPCSNAPATDHSIVDDVLRLPFCTATNLPRMVLYDAVYIRLTGDQVTHMLGLNFRNHC